MGDEDRARSALSRPSRRGLLRAAAALGFGLLGGALNLQPAAAAPRPQQYQGARFVVSSYGGSWDDAVRAGAADPIKARYPGLEIIIDPSGGFTKLLAQRDNPDADVCFVDDSAMPLAVATELAAPLDMTRIPNAADVYPQGKLFGDRGLAMQFGRFGLIYRKDRIIEPPTSWADMWRSEYKGRVAIGAPSPGGTAWVQFLVAAARLNGGDENNIEPGFAKLQELKPNLLTITETTAQIIQLLTDGELWLTPFWDGRTIAMKRQGLPVEFATPKEGAYGTITYITMVKGTRYADLAHEFINQLLSQEGQIAFVQNIGYGPTNRRVELPQSMIDEGVLYGQAQVEAMNVLDWNALAPKRGEWLERWNSVMR